MSHHLIAILVIASTALVLVTSNATFPPSLSHNIDSQSQTLSATYRIHSFNRTSFPDGFVFGVASSAYQTEGAADKDGRGPSIWDHFTHTFPEQIVMIIGSRDDFRDYADLCFKTFGNRVKNWITLNEPLVFSSAGYDGGSFAPGRCSSWRQNNCSGGDSGIEPYNVSHNQLLAHATVVKLYRHKYQAEQKGKIGITHISTWMVPYTNSSLDRRAAVRALDFMLGWFMGPIVEGDYPLTMRALVKERLPKFSANESKMVKGSYDFIGLNYYTSLYAAHDTNYTALHLSYTTDSLATLSSARDGVNIGEQMGSMLGYPKGIWHLLLYIKRKYNNPVIYITENGCSENNNATLSLAEALNDYFRMKYYYQHLAFALKAIKNGVNLHGYFGWTLMDNFEWSSGYTLRYGINYVDYNDGLKRYAKLSAQWFNNFLQT